MKARRVLDSGVELEDADLTAIAGVAYGPHFEPYCTLKALITRKLALITRQSHGTPCESPTHTTGPTP